MDKQITTGENFLGKGDGEEQRWPGLVDDAYPEVFTTVPKQTKKLKPGQLPEDKLKQFFEKVNKCWIRKQENKIGCILSSFFIISGLCCGWGFFYSWWTWTG